MPTVSRVPGLLPSTLCAPSPDAPVIARPLAASRLPAGFPLPSEDYAERRLDPTSYLVRNSASTFFFRVAGDSMVQALIHDGDILVVDRSIEPKHGHIVVAAIEGEFTVKRLFKRGQTIELRPENPAYAPIRFAEAEEVRVWGVVVGTFRRIEA